jgi:methionine-gamma-lyase
MECPPPSFAGCEIVEQPSCHARGEQVERGPGPEGLRRRIELTSDVVSDHEKKPRMFVRPETAVLTRGFDPRLSLGSARPAVFRSSTYVFSSPEAAERAFAIALGREMPREDEEVELIYSRLSHPNAEILEDRLVPLEIGATSAAVFNSGMAAISTLFLTLCPPGSSFVYTLPLYGGTQLLISELIETLGVRAIGVPAGDGPALEDAIGQANALALVFIETPANPTLRMTEIEVAVRASRRRAKRPVVAVDNTFLGPTFQHPLALGADACVYSATKFLAGFSDMLGGVIMTVDKALASAFRSTRVILGNILQPDECWLLESRLPTVSLRMNKQSKNASRIAQALVGHDAIEHIHYPGLFKEPEQARICRAQCDYPGSILSLELRRGKPAAFEFLRRLAITKNAVSLGGMESLACHPATTTHSELTPEQQLRYGVTPGLVRISIGIEDWRDLLAEYLEALRGL